MDFDLPEARVVLGPDGTPVDIQKVSNWKSHRLIEDFMLLANETVAGEAENRKLPIPYRVHEPPPRTDSRSSDGFWALWVIPIPNRGVTGKDLQKVLNAVDGKPEAGLVSTVVLRSMARARYQPRTSATSVWGRRTTPTSPHPSGDTRTLWFTGWSSGPSSKGKPIPDDWGGEALAQAAERSTVREGLATEAERDSVALKKAEFMERHLGEDFSGTVSGVTAFGFFVLLDEYFVEGLVHVNSLMDDYYILREDQYALVGERTGRRFRLGDSAAVQVSRVDRLERKIDFVLAGSDTPTGGLTLGLGGLT